MGLVVTELAPLVVTLKDGTVLHFNRTGRVLRSTGPSKARFLRGLSLRDAEFNPDQPRDEHGRWISPGGVHHTGVEWEQDTDAEGRPVPIRVDTVEEGVRHILNGKVVEVKDPQTAYTLIDELGKAAMAAEAAGEHPKDFDLCQVSVKGTNLFCAETIRTGGISAWHSSIADATTGRHPGAGE